jgi:hypothetical protein
MKGVRTGLKERSLSCLCDRRSSSCQVKLCVRMWEVPTVVSIGIPPRGDRHTLLVLTCPVHNTLPALVTELVVERAVRVRIHNVGST